MDLATVISNFKDNLETGCLEWNGFCIPAGKNSLGYGQVYFNKKSNYTHRLAYELFVGEIPKGMNVLHKCDNPKCGKPEHLFLGTQMDNSKDKCAKGRQPKGETHGQSKLTEEAVLVIRSSNLKQKDLAIMFSVSQQQISRVQKKDRWIY